MIPHSLDIPERRNQTERFVRRMMGFKVVIALSDELDLKCSTVGGFTGPAVHQLLPDNPEPVRTIVVASKPLQAAVDKVQRCLAFDAILLHELGHVAEHGFPVVDQQSDREHFQNLCSTPITEWPSHTGPKWAGHDCRFIRALLHIHHRMLSRGHRTPCLRLAFNHVAYGLSRIETYRDALGTEPEDNDWPPLAEILVDPMPAGFQTLWTNDVVRSLGLPTAATDFDSTISVTKTGRTYEHATQ